jgi:hypothetical protein
MIEHLFTFEDDLYLRTLLENPLNWNNYHYFNGPLDYVILENDIDFELKGSSYLELIKKGIECTVLKNRRCL